MDLSSPVLSDQQFAVGRALVGSVILQERMHCPMKEQTCSKRRPHDATAEGYQMLFYASAIPASKASPGYAPPAGGKWPAPEALPTADERSMPARVPERIPTSTHEQVREPTS